MDPGFHWPSIIMGWPAIGVALVVFVVALIVRRWWVAAAAAVIAMPFCFYLTMMSAPFGPLVALCNTAAVVALRQERPGLAALLLLPFLVVVSVLGVAVLWQFRLLDFATPR